jgi:hypothetical protein
LKAKIQRAVGDARARESDLEALCIDAPADPGGRWHAKDHLAHLASWRLRGARTLDALRTDAEPPPPVEDDEQNAAFYAENRDLTADEVKALARDSWVALETAVDRCTEEDLAKPHPREPQAQAWMIVPGVGGHLGVHLMWLYLEQGDRDRAEAAARWGYELETTAFASPEERAVADYNLACFYARVDQARDALPLLRQSFEARPSLVEIARRDPDLDPIRDDSELKELLAT